MSVRRVRVVSGATTTGLAGANGTTNVVLAPSPVVGMVGLYHPCGAYYVTVANDTLDAGTYAKDGSLYVTENLTNHNGPQRVIIVSGMLGAPGDHVNPVITSNPIKSVAEGNTLSVSLTADKTVTWSIAGGDDASLFEISTSTLRWKSNGHQTFAIPLDVNKDNIYEVSVQATDENGNYITQAIFVTVTEASYVAQAVHFDGFTHLDISSLSTTENGFLSFALWIKYGSGPSPLWMSYVHDVDDTIWNIARIDDGGIMYVEVDNPADGFFAVNSGDPPSINLQDGAWHSIIGTLRANLNEGLKIAKLYVDRTDVTNIVSDSGNAFDIFTNGTSHRFFAHISPHFTGDVADCRWMFGISLLTDNDIASDTLNLFVTADNKPVNPSIATATLGTVGTVLFSGDHTNFSNNQGTGGSFTLTGTLTNASTSPSD